MAKLFDLWQWEYGQIYEVEKSQDEEFTPESITKIQKWMVNNRLALPNSFSWVLKHKEGSFVKRYKKFLKQNDTNSYQLFNSGNLAGELGSLLGELSEQNYRIQFDKEFRWNAGDFGDIKSCYFENKGCRHYMLKNLRRRNCAAVQFLKPCGKGWGRTLIIPYDNAAVLINSYGIPLLRAAKVMSTACDLDTFEVQAVNHGYASNEFYINQGQGILMGPNPKSLSKVDFKWNIDSSYVSCSHCGNRMDEDSPEDIINLNGRTYCLNCVFYCERCQSHKIGTSCEVYDGDGNSQTVCVPCREQSYTECPCCSEFVLLAV